MQSNRARRALLITGAVALVVTLAPAAQASHGSTTRESLTYRGGEANNHSGMPAVTPDGRYIAFSSMASNLVAEPDANIWHDIYIRDRVTGAVELVSQSSNGAAGNSYSFYPSVSADGRFVAFVSHATTLVAGDSNNVADVFVRDRVARTTKRVSVTTAGAQVREPSGEPRMSADGRFVIFGSGGRLVPEDTELCANGTMSCWDVYRHDLVTGETIMVSKSSSGAPGKGGSWLPASSADGDVIAFTSEAANLVDAPADGIYDLFVRRVSTGTTTRVSAGKGGPNGARHASLSADGTKVAFVSDAVGLAPTDTNDREDVFVLDLATGGIVHASLTAAGKEARRFGGFLQPMLSPDGRYVTFASSISDLVANDTNTCTFYDAAGECPDVFVRDLQAGTLRRASVTRTGGQANGQSHDGVPLADGRVVFMSEATNLVPLDLNGATDIFMVHPTGCADGVESGPVSGAVHEVVEPVVDPADGIVHDANCSHVLGSGL